MNTSNQHKIALGTVQFGLHYGVANSAGQVTPAAVGAILDAARGHGIDTLDTAIAYGDSEAILGTAGVLDFKLISKLPPLPDETIDVARWVRKQAQSSLARLGIAALDGFLLHRPADLLGQRGTALERALAALVDDGLVRRIGVSIYAPEELDDLCAACPIGMVQSPFNLIDRRLASSGWLQRLHSMGIEVHTRSAFLQGLLLMARADIPARFAPWAAVWDAWHAWLREQDCSALQASLGFVLGFPGIDKVVVGVDGRAHLDSIVASAGQPAPPCLPVLPEADEVLLNPSRWPGK